MLILQKVALVQVVHQVMTGDPLLMLLQVALLTPIVTCLAARLMLTVDTTVRMAIRILAAAILLTGDLLHLHYLVHQDTSTSRWVTD